ncbi:MAG: SelT/SelW/SelH family protein [Deltaproteobacteria bacterium]|nr:SelT/SelW/SelH family protein [Deltaproteobacteria bacterium]
MRDQLQSEFGANIELIAGAGGVFTVTANGIEVFSKKKSGHFPEPDEIVILLKQNSK